MTIRPNFMPIKYYRSVGSWLLLCFNFKLHYLFLFKIDLYVQTVLQLQQEFVTQHRFGIQKYQ